MKRSELNEVVDRALLRLKALGHDYSFDASARKQLVSAAGGFPWFVHVIGQSALLVALEADTEEISKELLQVAIDSLVKNRFAQRFKDSYQLAVRDSSNREIVLRTFAAWPESDIPTATVYGTAKSLGVVNPAVYKGQLCSAKFGTPLIIPGFQERGLVRFRNEMFKQYINLTKSLYQDVSRDVARAATAWSTQTLTSR